MLSARSALGCVLGLALLVSACAEDPLVESATAICDAIDGEADDVAAFEGYELAVARERRAGSDVDALLAIVEERCGRAVGAVTLAAAALEEAGGDDAEPVAETDAEPEPDADPEPSPLPLTEVDWLAQDWTTDCTEDGDTRHVRLEVEDGVGAVRRPDGGALTPVYVVLHDDVVFGDVTGDGEDDAVFVTQCVFASAEVFVEVWSHDDEGQPLQLPVVAHYSKFEAVVDRVEAVDGRLHVHSLEGAPGDDTPHLDGYPVEVVTAWTLEGETWRPDELSRIDTTPEPEPPSPSSPDSSALPGCDEAASSVSGAARCLVAAVNAGDHAAAAAVAVDDVVATLSEWRREWGPLEWEFSSCEDTCWFFEAPEDPQSHGIGIEMDIGWRDGVPVITWVDTYG